MDHGPWDHLTSALPAKFLLYPGRHKRMKLIVMLLPESASLLLPPIMLIC